MLRHGSMSAKMAKVTNCIVTDNAGYVSEDELDQIMRKCGIVRQRKEYIDKLCAYEYITYDRVMGGYHATAESKDPGTIILTVHPSLYGEEVRRHLVETLAGFEGIIEISDVEI